MTKDQMMNVSLTENFLRSLVGKTVVFNNHVDEGEHTYVEAGMKAIVQKINFNMYDDDLSDNSAVVHEIFLNYEPFEEQNHLLMSSTYYNLDGVACLTALEAGWYESRDSIFISGFASTIPFELDQ